MKVQFHFNYKVSLSNRKKLKLYVDEIFKKEKYFASSLDIIFCDDEFLLTINREFLDHDFYTDIISFNLNSDLLPVEGEIYISIDRVKENASVYNCSVALELHRVIFHGVLHFCGYEDGSKRDKIIMRKKEDLYLKKYFVSRETN